MNQGALGDAVVVGGGVKLDGGFELVAGLEAGLLDHLGGKRRIRNERKVLMTRIYTDGQRSLASSTEPISYFAAGVCVKSRDLADSGEQGAAGYRAIENRCASHRLRAKQVERAVETARRDDVAVAVSAGQRVRYLVAVVGESSRIVPTRCRAIQGEYKSLLRVVGIVRPTTQGAGPPLHNNGFRRVDRERRGCGGNSVARVKRSSWIHRQRGIRHRRDYRFGGALG